MDTKRKDVDMDDCSGRHDNEIADCSKVTSNQVMSQLQKLNVPHFQLLMTDLMVKERQLGGTYIMDLPPQFVKEHGDKFQETVFLKTPHDRRVWTVRVRISTIHGLDKVSFGCGWGNFSRKNDLKVGDELIFSIVALSKFVVHIFHQGAYLEGCRQPEDLNDRSTVHEIVRAHRLKKEKLNVEKDNEGNAFMTSKDADCFRMQDSIADFVPAMKFDLESNAECGNKKSSGLKNEVIITPRDTHGVPKLYPQTLLSKINRLVEGYQCPHFVKLLRHSNSRFPKGAILNVPAEFSHKYGKYFEGMMNLLMGPNDRAMEVKCVKASTTKMQVHFATGWRQFYEDNELRLGDVLLFSLPVPSCWIVQLVERVPASVVPS